MLCIETPHLVRGLSAIRGILSKSCLRALRVSSEAGGESYLFRVFVIKNEVYDTVSWVDEL